MQNITNVITRSTASRPTESELDLELADLVNWQIFATLLPGLTSGDIEEIKQGNDNVPQQKLCLYRKWLQRCPNSSWENVILALEKAHENTLADILRKHFTISVSLLKPLCTVVHLRFNSDEEIELLDTLQALHKLYVSLVTEILQVFEDSIHKGYPTIKMLTRFIQVYMHWESVELEKIQDFDQLFTILSYSHCFDFLECGLIIYMVERFIGGNLTIQIKKYEKLARQVRDLQTVKNLKNELVKIYTVSQLQNVPQIFIELKEVWNEAAIECLNLLVKYILPKQQQSLLEYIIIDSGSPIEMKFVQKRELEEINRTVAEIRLLKNKIYQLKIDDTNIDVLPFSEVFLSYRQIDKHKQFAQDLFDQLKQQNFGVWRDDNGTQPGDSLPEKLSKAINKCDLFVCLLSKEYFDSEWCLKQIRFAQDTQKRLFAIHWGKDEIPDDFKFLLGDMLSHNYNPQADDSEKELQKCLEELISVITDERDQELFIEECKKGEIKIHPVKCILSGLPRVGKTSFMLRLQGQKPLDDSPSTGIERPVSITILERTNFAATIINQKGKWVHTNNVLEEGCLLLQHVKQLKVSSSGETTTDTSEDSSDDFDKSTVKDSLDHFNKPVEIPSSFKPSVDNGTKETKQRVHESFPLVHEFLSQVSSAQQIFENLKESTTVYFMDTGGQPEFHELLPPILHGPALHLIFFNASLDLNKPVQINYCHKEEIESFKYTSNSSSIEILHQLLSSFYFLQEKSNSVLLGSHIDLLDVDESQHHVMINKISDLLKQHMEETDYYKNAFLTYPTDSNNIFLPIDNKTASEEELEQVKKFLEIVFNQFEAVPLPITWATFHLILRYKYEKSGVCTITDCEDLTEKCGIKRENVVSVLRYLHNNVGTILYYENVDSLKELVICDPNVLFHGLSHLVTVSFAGSGINYTIADRIRKTGVIPRHVLDKAKSQDPSSPLNAQHLINLLKHYKLIKEVKQDGDISYFMPCLLQLENLTSSLSADVVKHLDTPPLVIMFQGGFIPLGVFSSLVIELSSKWKYDSKTLYRNHVDFNARSHRVELRSCFTYLEIRITAHDKPSFHCYQTRTFLKQCINDVLQSQRRTARIKVLEGVYCPGSFSCPSLHMCEYEDGYLTCTATERCREYINPFPLEKYPFQICWFEDNPSFSGQALPLTDDVSRLPTRSTNGRRQRREEEIESNATEGPGVDDGQKLKAQSEKIVEFVENVSPHDILKSHLVQLIDVITTPDRLANGLFAADLISNAVKNRVLSQQNLSHQDKASILVNQVLTSLKAFKDPKTLISFCDVLKNQDDPNLFRIANTMLGDLGIDIQEIQLPNNERSRSMTASTPRSAATNIPTNSDKKLPTGKSEDTAPLCVLILLFVFVVLISMLVNRYLY